MIWTLEGSNDNLTWHFIDYQNCDYLLTLNTIHSFKVKSPGTYRYFRFTQTGLNDDKRNFLHGKS